MLKDLDSEFQNGGGNGDDDEKSDNNESSLDDKESMENIKRVKSNQ